VDETLDEKAAARFPTHGRSDGRALAAIDDYN